MTKNVYAQRFKTPEQRFWEKVAKTPGCWEWTSAKSDYGHGVLWLKGGNAYAHRLSYEWANGPIAEGLFVCHKCDNPGCVNPEHLFLGTHQDNMDDMARKGRAVKGEQHRGAQASELMVQRIRIIGKALPLSRLSALSGLSISALHSIRARDSWKSLSQKQALA